MKSFNQNFLNVCARANRDFRAYAIIEAPDYDIYLTSDSGIISVTGSDVLIDGVIENIVTGSEEIKPEDGISVLGGGSISLKNDELINRLRIMSATGKTIFNRKVKCYIGDASLDVADYQLVQTLRVKNIQTTSTGASISLKTSRFLTDKTIFEEKSCIVTTSFTAQEELTQIEVNTTNGFSVVAHDAQYSDSPNQEVGYLIVVGQDINGNDVTEVIKWWSKDASHFYGDPSNGNKLERSCFNTGRVAATGQIGGETATEIREYKYLELPYGKMLIALLTGDLYGQVGKSLPDHWHCGIDAADIDLASFENLGNDYWDSTNNTGMKTYIAGLKEQQAQSFISKEFTRLGVLLITDQFARLKAKRYSQVIVGGAGDVYLGDGDVINKPTFARDTTDIVNKYVVQWDYRQLDDSFARFETLIDQESQIRNDYVSKAEIVQLKIIRNDSLQSNESIKTLLDSMRSRKSSPAIKPTIQCNLARTANLEIGDQPFLKLDNFKDWTGSDGINRPFEIQSLTTDWKGGVVTMKLYGASDILYPLTKEGTIPTISNAGWTPITSALTGSFTDTGGVLTLTSDCVLASAAVGLTTRSYYYDGLINHNGFKLTTHKSARIRCSGYDVRGATIDGKGLGGAGGTGYADDPVFDPISGVVYGDIGMVANDYPLEGYAVRAIGISPNTGRFRYAGNFTKTEGYYPNVPDLKLRVNSDNVLQGTSIYYHGGGGTGSLPVIYDIDVDLTVSGADGGNGGAGLHIITEYFLYDGSTVVDFSGNDGAVNTAYYSQFNCNLYAAGAGGNGGCLYISITDVNQALPNNVDGWFVSKNGKTTYELPSATNVYKDNVNRASYTFKDGSRASANGNEVWPFVDFNAVESVSEVDFANVKLKVGYLTAEEDSKIISGVDNVPLVAAPENLTLTESIDTPSTPLGNISTISATVTAPSDANYSHTEFIYREASKLAWYPLNYKTGEGSTFEAISNGSTYIVTAYSVSKAGVRGNSAQAQITIKNVLTQPATEASVQIPPVRGLALRNKIARTEFNKFKSGNAEFIWKDASNNSAVEFAKEGLLGAGSGAKDPYFKDYQVTIKKTNGQQVRQEFVTQPSYTYTLEKNKVDGTGRQFTIEVAARGQNNQVGTPQIMTVENPEPSAPTGLSAKPSYNQIVVDFVPPTDDIDYKGINMRYRLSGGTWSAILFLAATSSCTVAELNTGTEYEIELTSVDQFGSGGTTSVVASTVAIPAAEIDGLSNWATELDPVDLAFINANMEDNSLPSTKIENLTAGKITAGTVTVAVDVGTGVQLDGTNGVVQTLNSGFKTVVGSADGAWNQLPNPTTFTAIDTNTNTQTLGIDTSGRFIFGNGDNSVSFDGSVIEFGANVTIGKNDNQTVTVGSGGDFSDWDDAVEYLSKTVPAYKAGGFTASVELLSGYVITTPLHVKGLDLSWIRITSSFVIDVDSSVIPLYGSSRPILIGTDGARLPILDLDLTDLDSLGTIAYLRNGSYLKSESSRTFTDFYNGIEALETGTIIDFTGVEFDGIVNYAALLSEASMSFLGGTLTNCNNGFYVTDLAKLSAYSMQSILTLTRLFTVLQNGVVSADSMTLSDAGASGAYMIYVDSGQLFLNNAFLQVTSFNASSKSHIYGRNALIDISDATLLAASSSLGIVDIYSGEVRAEGVNDTDINIFDGSTVRAHNAVNTTFNQIPNILYPVGIIFN